MQKKILTVTELTRYIKDTLESMVGRVCVTGEISGFKLASSGHAYFTLKDEGAALNCVMFRSSFGRVPFPVSDGMQVEATGNVTLYPPRGQYQLVVERLVEAGIGILFRRFEELKKRLGEEGLFDPVHKKPLPYLPRRIGVITSATGAAVRDIINVLTRRFSHLEIYVYPTLVQGKEAAGQIARAIGRMNELGMVDVLIVGRGGGSIEDLWSFNEEEVARAIFASKIPVISAVGHETDFTIADFVADLRAPTPSAAAELVTANHENLMEGMQILGSRLDRAILNWIELRRLRIRELAASHSLHSPVERLRQTEQRLDELTEAMRLQIDALLQSARQRFDILEARLRTLNPEAVLSRGYSILLEKDTREVVMDSRKVTLSEPLEARLWRGKLDVEVTGIVPPEKKKKGDGE